MAFQTNTLSSAGLKQLVKNLRRAHQEVRASELPQHQAQEIVARQLGHQHWHAAIQVTKEVDASVQGSGPHSKSSMAEVLAFLAFPPDFENLHNPLDLDGYVADIVVYLKSKMEKMGPVVLEPLLRYTIEHLSDVQRESSVLRKARYTVDLLPIHQMEVSWREKAFSVIVNAFKDDILRDRSGKMFSVAAEYIYDLPSWLDVAIETENVAVVRFVAMKNVDVLDHHEWLKTAICASENYQSMEIFDILFDSKWLMPPFKSKSKDQDSAKIKWEEEAHELGEKKAIWAMADALLANRPKLIAHLLLKFPYLLVSGFKGMKTFMSESGYEMVEENEPRMAACLDEALKSMKLMK
jgi:hypothetical protein